jgi:hypothetical protein
MWGFGGGGHRPADLPTDGPTDRRTNRPNNRPTEGRTGQPTDGDCPAMGAHCPATGAKGSGCPAMGADCPATGAEGSGCPATAAKEGREFMDCFWGSATKGFQSSVLRKNVWFV